MVAILCPYGVVVRIKGDNICRTNASHIKNPVNDHYLITALVLSKKWKKQKQKTLNNGWNGKKHMKWSTGKPNRRNEVLFLTSSGGGEGGSEASKNPGNVEFQTGALWAPLELRTEHLPECSQGKQVPSANFHHGRYRGQVESLGGSFLFKLSKANGEWNCQQLKKAGKLPNSPEFVNCPMITLEFSLKKKNPWASLVAQWLRICLPMQGARVQALV